MKSNSAVDNKEDIVRSNQVKIASDASRLSLVKAHTNASENVNRVLGGTPSEANQLHVRDMPRGDAGGEAHTPSSDVGTPEEIICVVGRRGYSEHNYKDGKRGFICNRCSKIKEYEASNGDVERRFEAKLDKMAQKLDEFMDRATHDRKKAEDDRLEANAVLVTAAAASTLSFASVLTDNKTVAIVGSAGATVTSVFGAATSTGCINWACRKIGLYKQEEKRTHKKDDDDSTDINHHGNETTDSRRAAGEAKKHNRTQKRDSWDWRLADYIRHMLKMKEQDDWVDEYEQVNRQLLSIDDDEEEEEEEETNTTAADSRLSTHNV